jgi:hypothetical protein
MLQPRIPEQRIIPLLMQMQLSPMSQSRIHLAIPVNIRGDHPAARRVMQVIDRAFSNIDKQANWIVAPGKLV